MVMFGVRFFDGDRRTGEILASEKENDEICCFENRIFMKFEFYFSRKKQQNGEKEDVKR